MASFSESFPNKYKNFIKQSRTADKFFGFDLRGLARIEPVLKFLHDDWWRVKTFGFQHLPHTGPAMIVGNASGLVPWTALMLIYSLMTETKPTRRIHVLADMDWIDDERVYAVLAELGFVPWSKDNAKRLFDSGELVAIFPEGPFAFGKTIVLRNRVNELDWTRLMPAVESGIKIYPLATLGCDEAQATLFNLESLAKLLKMKAFPISPFFPWLPFPFNLMTLPVNWRMHLLKANGYEIPQTREGIEILAQDRARFIEGEIQAELNRLLRGRHRGPF